MSKTPHGSVLRTLLSLEFVSSTSGALPRNSDSFASASHESVALVLISAKEKPIVRKLLSW